MAYSRVTWEDGTTALSAEHMNNIEEGIGEAMLKAEGNTDMWAYIRNLVYPVGSIYMSASLSTVASVEAALGGTWVAWGSGRVPVGVNGSDSNFNTVEKTGGASTVTLTSAQSGVPAHSHGVGTIVAKLVNHVHTIAHTHTLSHTHTMAHTHSVGGTTSTADPHSHGKGTLVGYTPKLTADNDDYVHAPRAMSANTGTINSSSSASYSYLRMAASGTSARSIGRDAPSIPSGKTVSIDGAVANGGAHSHTISFASGGASTSTTSGASTSTTSGASNANSGNPTTLPNCTMSGSTANNTAANASSAHTNLQPYITCFMYKRIA